MSTFVIVHGGWDGGWAWRGVARKLQAAGHEVFTVTLTGCGEKVHLASPKISLNTHILDVVNVLQYENLTNVILVGHSYGGIVITGVAEQIPERIEQMIYLDAFLPENGDSIASMMGQEMFGYMEQVAQKVGDGWRVPHEPSDDDRRTALLINTGKQSLTVCNPDAAALKHTYVQFVAKTAKDFTKPLMERMAARAKEKGWNYLERPFHHFPQLEKSEEVAKLLLELI